MISMERKKLVLQKLTEINENEWITAMKKCKELIDLRVKGRTKYGCHSEERLGMIPFDYYFQIAIDKLYDGVWNWQFEKYSISEQLCRIIGSVISEEVRKYKVEENKNFKPLGSFHSFDELAFFIGVDIDEYIKGKTEKEIYEEQLNIIEQAIEGKDKMELLFLLILEGKSNEEICEELDWKKKALYKTAYQMKKRVKNYIDESPK